VDKRCVEQDSSIFFFFTKNLRGLAQNADVLGLSITRKRFKGDLCVNNSYFIDVPFLNVFSGSNAIF